MKKYKKFLSLLLAIIMIFSMAGFALAKENYKQNCPVIFIHGFSSSEIYADVNDPDSLMSFPDVNEILTAVADTLVPALGIYFINKDADVLTSAVTKRINKMLEPWFNNPDGTTQEGSGVAPRELKNISKKSRLTFRYDWRSDPVVIADNLHQFIETVLDLSGCKKVALGCHSLGSSVALAYLSKYGNSKVSAMVFDSPACNGVALIGNILTGKVNLDGEAIGSFLKEMLGESEYKKLVSGFIDILESAGLFEAFSLFADDVIAELAPGIYKGTVAPLVGGWPTLWSMLPDDKVATAKNFIFDEILKGEDYSGLEAKIDSYNSSARLQRTQLLRDFNNVGKFAILSRYNNQTIPLRESSMLIGDLIIETEASSFGATTAPKGTCFSDEYLEDKDMAYISPDKTVDASTCLFPEQTWFIKNSGHFETEELTKLYYDMFFFSKQELTCDTAELGRFIYNDKPDYVLKNDNTTPQTTEKPTLMKSIFAFVYAFIEALIAFMSKQG